MWYEDMICVYIVNINVRPRLYDVHKDIERLWFCLFIHKDRFSANCFFASHWTLIIVCVYNRFFFISFSFYLHVNMDSCYFWEVIFSWTKFLLKIKDVYAFPDNCQFLLHTCISSSFLLTVTPALDGVTNLCTR